jgi:hypothetical protein
LSEDDFTDLSDDLADKYGKLFESPEVFYNINGQIRAQKVDPQPEQTLPTKKKHKSEPVR